MVTSSSAHTLELTLHRIQGHRPGPHLLITGGVHGDEFEPMAAIRRLIAELQPEALSGRLTLIPVVNEPAFRLGQRTAEDGLDLARSCPGKVDGTITERIAFALSEQIRSADYYIDLHTGGTRLCVLPMVGYMLHPDARVLQMQRQMARAFGLPIIWGTDPTLNGRSLSVARDASIPALYAEYQGGGRCDPSGIEAYVRGCRQVMVLLRMLNDSPASSMQLLEEPVVVEDDRPGSGHMQVNHPSPCEGFFEPAVVLGQVIKKGEQLGTVTDLLGDNRSPIRANRSGIVLVLHTFSHVDSGVSVAVVLETARSAS